MKIKLGPDDGNSLALIRWGRNLDQGIWLVPKGLWIFRFYRPSLYLRLWIVAIRLKP